MAENQKILEEVLESLYEYSSKMYPEQWTTMSREAYGNRNKLLKKGFILPHPYTQQHVGLYKGSDFAGQASGGVEIPGQMGTWNQIIDPNTGLPYKDRLPGQGRINYKTAGSFKIKNPAKRYESLRGKTFREAAKSTLGREYLTILKEYGIFGSRKKNPALGNIIDPIWKGKKRNLGVVKLAADWALREHARELYIMAIAKSISNPNVARAGMLPGTKGYHYTDNLTGVMREGLKMGGYGHQDMNLQQVARFMMDEPNSARGAFFTIGHPDESRLPGHKKAPMLVEADLPTLIKKGYITSPEIARTLIPGRAIPGEIQAGRAIPSKYLTGYSIKQAQHLNDLLTNLNSGPGGKNRYADFWREMGKKSPHGKEFRVGSLRKLTFPLLFLSLMLPIFMGRKKGA